MKKLLTPLLLIFIIGIFYFPFLVHGKLPIPADTIIGLYHPYRDLYAKEYPNGVPYKNFLITDPVRQTIPWRILSITTEKSLQFPLWNPYTASGTPLLGTFQSAPFYPLNILLFILPFAFGWSVLIFLQQILAGVFMFYFLHNYKLQKSASFLGGVTYAFCGFFISWLEWGTIGQVVLWLPLVLLSIDRSILCFTNAESSKFQSQNYVWPLIFLFSLTSSFLGGHAQSFFYLYIVVITYFIAKWLLSGTSKKLLFLFIILNSLFLILTAIQWYPFLQFIQLSARNVDQSNWHKDGWFIPWQHLIQFVVPDFFGNPTTLNYWGTWNYGEFIGYVGIMPLIFALYASFFRNDKKTFFFGTLFFLSLIFSLPTVFAKLPYVFQIPFISTSQPTRLLFITDFSLSILAALGFDYLLKTKQKRHILFPLLFLVLIVSSLWIFLLTPNKVISPTDMLTAKHNIYFPAIILFTNFLIVLGYIFIKNKNVQKVLILLLIALTVVDLLRFSQKFTPFTNKQYLFPSTQTLTYLEKQSGQFRIMTTNSEILPPNFSVMYHLQSIDNYDPLYLLRYGEFMTAIQRNKPDITPPFGFNRIIHITDPNSPFVDLLGVKYILSFSELTAPKFTKVFTEGKTQTYINNFALPRVFFVTNVTFVSDKQSAMNMLYEIKNDLRRKAVVESFDRITSDFSNGQADITRYQANEVSIRTQNDRDGFLVFTDSFYPTWQAKICNSDLNNCSETKIYQTDFNFRGIIVPKGNHSIIFTDNLL